MVGSLFRLWVSGGAGVAVSGDGDGDGGCVAAGGGGEGDVKRDRAAAGDEQGAKDGDAERTAGLAGGVEDSGGQADAVSGAWVTATAVMAGIARAVKPRGTLDVIRVASGPRVGFKATSSAPVAPATRPARMTGHSQARGTTRPLRNAIATVTMDIGSRASPLSSASRPRA